MTAAPASISRTDLLTLPGALARWARTQPEAPALAQGGEQLTYRELAAVVEDLAGRLGQAGVVSGERVALVGENTVEWATCSSPPCGSVPSSCRSTGGSARSSSAGRSTSVGRGS